ncbi:hypothetical protein SAMN05421821_103337 [Mucilaginibacter lappiensis]|uniref:Uncharacterized protein n=1 Tax=Mucilaginibacter lappiensis TaxID=354630 RepID=A0A1N6VD31_9SPHI|nr:hypothetical protein [Mucilaginibacter lappiensis]MBB6127307.1 hypothetical protein [Mucilaginibacter lappiensis]SIQ75649.1 hypothetical protein SAMN05421821_103337 [Mucilaginibacter lappiensis]
MKLRLTDKVLIFFILLMAILVQRPDYQMMNAMVSGLHPNWGLVPHLKSFIALFTNISYFLRGVYQEYHL